MAATQNLQCSENDSLFKSLQLALKFEVSRRIVAPGLQKILKSLNFRALRIFS